jgi:hypothetical protein
MLGAPADQRSGVQGHDLADGGDANQQEPACGAQYHPYDPVELKLRDRDDQRFGAGLAPKGLTSGSNCMRARQTKSDWLFWNVAKLAFNRSVSLRSPIVFAKSCRIGRSV